MTGEKGIECSTGEYSLLPNPVNSGTKRSFALFLFKFIVYDRVEDNSAFGYKVLRDKT